MRAIVLLAALLGSSIPSTAASFNKDDHVITIRRTVLSTPVIPGRTQSVAHVPLEPGTALIVENVQDGLLWVNDVQPGWVRSSDVASPEEARVIFSTLIAQNRFVGDPYVYRGTVLMELEEYESAHRDFAEAILREARNLSAAYIGRAEAVGKSPVTLRAAARNLRAALNPWQGLLELAVEPVLPTPAKDLDAALAKDRRNPKVLLARASIELGGTALPYINEALRHNPLSASAYIARMKRLVTARNLHGAVADFAEVSFLDPSLATLHQDDIADAIEAQPAFASIARLFRQGIYVMWSHPFPPHKSQTISFKRAKDSAVESYVPTLGEALQPYPDAVIDMLGPQHIVLINNLKSTSGDPCGLFDSETKTIYLEVAPAPAYDRPRVIHHEMFHAMYARGAALKQIDRSAWKNPAGFSYLGTERYKTATLSPGFVSTYAMSDIQEDMAETFAYLATGGNAKIWGDVKCDDVLKAKIRRIKEFVKNVFHMDLPDAGICPTPPTSAESGAKTDLAAR